MAIILEEELSSLAADVAAISPAPVRKAVDALAQSSPARAAADALIYLCVATACAIFAAAFLTIVADQACVGGWGCAPAYVLTEISNCLGILALLLLPPALVLFFLRAAGCTSKAADGESLIVKDVEEPPSSFSKTILSPLPFALLCLFIGATSMGIISFVLYMYGYSEISDLFGDAAILCMLLCEALFYIRAAMALWRMRASSFGRFSQNQPPPQLLPESRILICFTILAN